MHFPFDDHFVNSHNLFSWLSNDIVRRNLMLVALGIIWVNYRRRGARELKNLILPCVRFIFR